MHPEPHALIYCPERGTVRHVLELGYEHQAHDKVNVPTSLDGKIMRYRDERQSPDIILLLLNPLTLPPNLAVWQQQRGT